MIFNVMLVMKFVVLDVRNLIVLVMFFGFLGCLIGMVVMICFFCVMVSFEVSVVLVNFG